MSDGTGEGTGNGWAPIDPAPPTPSPSPAGPPMQAPVPPPFAAAPPHAPKAGDTRTGPLPLHPMTLSDVLDGAFKLFRANVRTVVLIVAAIMLPVQIAISFVLRDAFSVGVLDVIQDPTVAEVAAQEDTTSAAQLIVTMLAVVVSLLVTPFVAGAISRVVAASYLGDVIGPGDALKVAARRFPALLGSFALVHLLEWSGLILCGIGALVTIPMFMALFVVVAPAVAIEEIGPIKAMRRSWRLVRPRFWSVLGIALLAGLISSILGQIIGTAPTLVAVFVGGSFAWILIAIGGVLSSMIATPVVAIVATLLYFDARIRSEGFDLQMMARDLNRGPAAG